jgi:hypothetical protein
MTAKHLLSEIVAGLDGVTPGEWRRVALGGSSTVLSKSRPPRNDTMAASYGYRDEEYCLAHTFLDDDNSPRMDFVCFGHADAAHIARLSPDRIRAIAAYVEQLEKALEPFAKAAEKADATAERMGFAPSFDAYAPTWTFSFGELRRARAALGGSNE